MFFIVFIRVLPGLSGRLHSGATAGLFALDRSSVSTLDVTVRVVIPAP